MLHPNSRGWSTGFRTQESKLWWWQHLLYFLQNPCLNLCTFWIDAVDILYWETPITTRALLLRRKKEMPTTCGVCYLQWLCLSNFRFINLISVKISSEWALILCHLLFMSFTFYALYRRRNWWKIFVNIKFHCRSTWRSWILRYLSFFFSFLFLCS